MVLLLAGLLCLDGAVMAGRVRHFPVRLHPGSGTTWLLVGLDSRADLPAGASTSQFGGPDEVPGSRADVVLVAHETDRGTTVLSVPRDVLVGGGDQAGRLALSWLGGPQATVDRLCEFGIPSDHVVAVDLAGFVAIVDALGGIDVDVPQPVRDPLAGLLVERGGRRHVDGATALALVRSRYPEHRIDGRWVPAPVDPDGRASAAAAVVAAVASAARGSLSEPVRLQRVGWAVSGALSTDPGTSMRDLASLATLDTAHVRVLPVSEPLGGTLVRAATADTEKALTAAGLSCDG